MPFDPVIQWERFVAACNERDWLTAESLVADDFEQVVVAGAVYKPTPTQHFDKAGFFALVKRLAERHGWMHRIRSIAGQDDALVLIYEDQFDDRSSATAYAIAQFNDRGQVAQVYTSAPSPR